MAYTKKEKAPKESKGNILNDPEQRKKFKSALSTVTHYLQQIDDQREGMKETVAELSAEYGVDKKIINKLAKTMFNHDYGTRLEEEQHFQILYETVIEGRARDTSDVLGDALDNN
jgi:ribosome-binding protein aMBF1 (putative translation factor)